MHDSGRADGPAARSQAQLDHESNERGTDGWEKILLMVRVPTLVTRANKS